MRLFKKNKKTEEPKEIIVLKDIIINKQEYYNFIRSAMSNTPILVEYDTNPVKKIHGIVYKLSYMKMSKKLYYIKILELIPVNLK